MTSPAGVAAVTGASRGIGRATALLLARHGYRVFALARSKSDLAGLAEEAASHGLAVDPISLDIAHEESRRQAVQAILEATDGYGLDVLVNNAGYGQMGPLEELPIERLRRQLEVNVIGLLAFTQPFLPKMRERHSGWIVNVGSIAGRIATPFMGAYNTSKFALEGLSDALRRELAPFGVHVVLIEPGPIRTQFGAVARQEDVASPGSPYAALRAGMSTAHGGTNLFERSAESVARVILRAVRSPHPRARYTVTLPAKLGTFAYRLVPALLVDWAMNRAMRLRGGFER